MLVLVVLWSGASHSPGLSGETERDWRDWRDWLTPTLTLTLQSSQPGLHSCHSTTRKYKQQTTDWSSIETTLRTTTASQLRTFSKGFSCVGRDGEMERWRVSLNYWDKTDWDAARREPTTNYQHENADLQIFSEHRRLLLTNFSLYIIYQNYGNF